MNLSVLSVYMWEWEVREVGGGKGLGEEGRTQGRREVTWTCNYFLGIIYVFFRKRKQTNKQNTLKTNQTNEKEKKKKKSPTKQPETQHHFSVSLGTVPFVLLPISCILTLGEPEALHSMCSAVKETTGAGLGWLPGWDCLRKFQMSINKCSVATTGLPACWCVRTVQSL